MALYEINTDNLTKISQTTFDQAGLRERDDLQRLLKKQIAIIAPDTLVIAEEFGEWEESKRRIDLLGLDKDANLVVIELKRTEDGGHMELQAIRYSAMVSTMTFDRVVDIHSRYLTRNNIDSDARTEILDFLGRDEPDEDSFAQDVKIVLVSANFSKEMTTTVLWLNKRDLDIRCVRLVPYQDNGRILIDVQQVIPLPEAVDYQIQIKEKEQKERKEKSERLPMHRFWQELLRRGEGATALHTQMTPGERSYIGANAGAKGLRYYYCASKTGSRVEIYIDRADVDTNKVIFDQLFSHKEEIETAFGNSLFWQRLDTKRACRISYDLPLGVYKDVESDWETIQTALIETMVKFERAFSPFIT